MIFTLREKEKNTPLFLDDGIATSKKTDQVVEFNTINELAMAMINSDIKLSSSLQNVVVTTLDRDNLLTRKMIKNPSEEQDLSSDLKLIPVFKYNTDLMISSKRPVRIYFKNQDLIPKLSDKDVDDYFVVRTPKKLSKHLKIGDKIVSCEDGYAKIYPSINYELVDQANDEKLYDNLNGIDLDNFSYYIAKKYR